MALIPVMFSVLVFCLFLWPAAAAVAKLLGLADDWPTAFRWGGLCGLVIFFITACDLIHRWCTGKKLEPTEDDE